MLYKKVCGSPFYASFSWIYVVFYCCRNALDVIDRKQDSGDYFDRIVFSMLYVLSL